MTTRAPDRRVTSVRVAGTTYQLVFAALFRPHTVAERLGLKESVRRHGFRVRVLTYDSANWGPRCVIDGAARLELAAELAREGASPGEVHVQHLFALGDEDAQELALSLNRDRRHLTPAEQHEARLERIVRIVAARAGGESLRTIGTREGVSAEQVRRDLEQSGVSGVTPDHVRGADGKSYPVSAPEFAGVGSGAEGVTPHAEQEPDDTSEPVPRTPQWLVADVRRLLAEIRSLVDELLVSSWGEHLYRHLVYHGAEHALATLDAAFEELAAEMAKGFGADADCEPGDPGAQDPGTCDPG
jgi:hypothetical protein